MVSYSLRREKDDAGDFGDMCMSAYLENDSNKIIYSHDARPEVGATLRVGTMYTGTMKWENWWQTSIITEIIEESENEVKFRTTSGSDYIWKRFQGKQNDY